MKIDFSHLIQKDIAMIESIVATWYEIIFALGLDGKKLFGNAPCACLRMFDYKEATTR